MVVIDFLGDGARRHTRRGLGKAAFDVNVEFARFGSLRVAGLVEATPHLPDIDTLFGAGWTAQ
jgi:hypothetical protein